MRTFRFFHIFIVLLFVPLITYGVNIKDIAQDFLAIFSWVIPIIVTIALLVFIWGISQFILKGDDEKAREEGKWYMIWGIIALFVMISVWGLVRVIQYTFSIEGTTAPVRVEPISPPSRGVGTPR